MGDIDVVLLRLTTEPDFCRAVAADPTRALAPYQLTAEDRELLWLQARTTAPDRWSISPADCPRAAALSGGPPGPVPLGTS